MTATRGTDTRAFNLTPLLLCKNDFRKHSQAEQRNDAVGFTWSDQRAGNRPV